MGIESQNLVDHKNCNEKIAEYALSGQYDSVLQIELVVAQFSLNEAGVEVVEPQSQNDHDLQLAA